MLLKLVSGWFICNTEEKHTVDFSPHILCSIHCFARNFKAVLLPFLLKDVHKYKIVIAFLFFFFYFLFYSQCSKHCQAKKLQDWSWEELLIHRRRKFLWLRDPKLEVSQREGSSSFPLKLTSLKISKLCMYNILYLFHTCSRLSAYSFMMFFNHVVYM